MFPKRKQCSRSTVEICLEQEQRTPNHLQTAKQWNKLEVTICVLKNSFSLHVKNVHLIKPQCSNYRLPNMGVGAGKGGPPHFEIWHFLIKLLAKNVVFLVSIGKNETSPVFAPLGKNPSDAHAAEVAADAFRSTGFVIQDVFAPCPRTTFPLLPKCESFV